MTKPSYLPARLLKAKYFPHSSFFEAQIEQSPSFIWRGICAGKSIVQEKSRRNIRLGNIPILGILWLVGENAYINAETTIPTCIRISDLFLPECGAWDEGKVRSLFDQDTSNRIFAIIPSMYGDRDHWYWEADKSGEYSVRSVYRALCSLGTLWTPSTEALEWRTVWRLKVPPKVKICFWRAISNLLPTKASLFQKGVCWASARCENVSHRDPRASVRGHK